MAVLPPNNLSSRDTSVVTRKSGRCSPKITHFSNKNCIGIHVTCFLATLSNVKIIERRYKNINEYGPLVEWHGQWKTAVLGENTPLAPLCPPQIPHGLPWEYLLLFYPAPHPTRCRHCEALSSTDINALIRLRIIYFWDVQSVSLGITARRDPRLWTENSVNTGRSALAWSTAWQLTNLFFF